MLEMTFIFKLEPKIHVYSREILKKIFFAAVLSVFFSCKILLCNEISVLSLRRNQNVHKNPKI